MNSTIDDQLTGGNNLDEPHFDEEATILAARPVVPLDEVKAEKRSKTGLALTLAIVGGLLIGLLAATLIFRYLSAKQSSNVETTAVAEQPASQAIEQPSNQLPNVSGGVAVGVDETPIDDSADEQPPTDTNNSQPEREEPKTARIPDRTPEVEPRRPDIVREAPRRIDDELDEEADREIRRAQRQEERRERRRAAREAKRQNRQPTSIDDLTRIREIFEGAPKP